MRKLRPLEPGEIEEIGFSMDDEEYNKLLDDIEKLQSDEPVIVDGILFSTLGNMTDEERDRILNTPIVPEPDYSYQLSPWYGKARDEFLKETMDETIYTICKNLGLLQWHLIEINERAFDMEEKLVAEISAKEGVDGELKKLDQLGWVRRTNNIKNRAREIIRQELITIPIEGIKVEDIDMDYVNSKLK